MFLGLHFRSFQDLLDAAVLVVRGLHARTRN
jgi:hypothetical protein